MHEKWERLMTALFGPRCDHGCGMRVFRKEKDLAEHVDQYCLNAVR
jgi:uncharacterized C2H2 Zn-finger protein